MIMPYLKVNIKTILLSVILYYHENLFFIPI